MMTLVGMTDLFLSFFLLIRKLHYHVMGVFFKSGISYAEIESVYVRVGVNVN